MLSLKKFSFGTNNHSNKFPNSSIITFGISFIASHINWRNSHNFLKNSPIPFIILLGNSIMNSPISAKVFIILSKKPFSPSIINFPMLLARLPILSHISASQLTILLNQLELLLSLFSLLSSVVPPLVLLLLFPPVELVEKKYYYNYYLYKY